MKVSVVRAERAKRRSREEETSSGDSGMPLFMEELMGTVGGETVVSEGRLFRSHYDLYDQYGTMLFGSGHRVEVAKTLINRHCCPEGVTKRRRINNIVQPVSKPADIPKPSEPKPTGPRVEATKDPEPAAAKPFDVKDIEEGELQVGDTLLSLGRRGVAGSSTPPDWELEAIEGLNVDEAGELRLCIILRFMVCLGSYTFVLHFAALSESMKHLLSIMHGPGTTGILPPERGEAGHGSVLFLCSF